MSKITTKRARAPPQTAKLSCAESACSEGALTLPCAKQGSSQDAGRSLALIFSCNPDSNAEIIWLYPAILPLISTAARLQLQTSISNAEVREIIVVTLIGFRSLTFDF